MLSNLINKSNQSVHFQPRMGIKESQIMANSLARIKAKKGMIGTLTLDSFTRQYDHDSVQKAMESNGDLNGFPIMFYEPDHIKELISSLQDDSFCIQVRHGIAQPFDMVSHMIKCGLVITEGGPISYCLPYSRLPLHKSIRSWQDTTRLLAKNNGHLETFSGCMMGQLSPPSLLIALNIIEGLFFKENGLKDVSFSYSQSYNFSQDVAAVEALKHLIKKYLRSLESHIVIYTFMGAYPETDQGHHDILTDSFCLAHVTGCKRLIYKTRHEAYKIPTVQENLDQFDDLMQKKYSSDKNILPFDSQEYETILQDAENIIQSVLNLSSNLNTCIEQAFEKGILDIPYCLHPQNKGITRSWIDNNGYVRWFNPFLSKKPESDYTPSSDFLLRNIYFNRCQYDLPRK